MITLAAMASETPVKTLLPILLAIKSDNLLIGFWCVGRAGMITVSVALRELADV